MKTKLITTLGAAILTLAATAQVSSAWNADRDLLRDVSYTHWGDVYTQRDQVEFIAVAEDSTVYVAGQDTTGFDFADNSLFAIAGGSSYVLKYKADGTEAWGTSIFGAAYASHIVATTDNGVIVAGRFTGEIDVEGTDGNTITLTKDDITGSYPYAFIASYTNEGIVSWAKAFEFDTITSDPASFQIADFKVKNDKILLTGSTYGAYTMGDSTYSSTAFDAWGAMLSNPSSYAMMLSEATGEVENMFIVPAESIDQNFTYGVGIDADSEGNVTVATIAKGSYILNGDTLSTAVDLSGWVPAYAQALIFTTYTADGSYVSSKTINNNVIIGSYYQNDISVSSLAYANDDKLFVAGRFVGIFSLSASDSLMADTANLYAYDAYVLKVATDGSIIKSFSYGTANSDQAPQMTISKDSVYLASDFVGDLSLTEGLTASAENSDLYIASLNLDAQVSHLYTVKSDSAAYLYSIATTPNNNVAFSAAFQKSITVLGEEINSTEDNYRALVSSIDFSDKTVAGVFTPKSDANLNIYPNPATSSILVDACDEIIIYSLAGVEVLRQSQPTSVDISAINSGLYMAKLSKDKAVSIIKLIKE